jgi:hypothetical protein
MGRVPEPANPTSPPREPERRLGDTLGDLARKRPQGGRAKWVVWAVFAVPVVVLGLLQIFGVLKNPVADRVLERRRQAEEQKRGKGDTPPPETEPGK